MAVISVDGLTKRFGPVVAVDDLSFDVEAGTVAGFLGPNGAGKTTTLRCLLGLVSPSEGAATILGSRYEALGDPVRRVGAVLEASGFHPARRAIDHLRIAATTAGLPDDRPEEVLAEVGMAAFAGRRVGGFSLGMRQRLALAGALLGRPEVLILDEPGNGLDPEGMHWLRGFLRAFADRGGTVLVSSHVLAEVAQTVDEVVIIHRGRLIQQAPIEAVGAADTVRVRSPAASRLRQLLADAGIESSQHGDGALTVHGGTAAKVGEIAAASGIVLHELAPQASTLEEVFLELTADQAETRA